MTTADSIRPPPGAADASPEQGSSVAPVVGGGMARGDQMEAAERTEPNSTVASQLEERWNRIRHYGLCIAGWNLMLPSAVYSELLVDPAIAPLPTSPTHFCGLVNLRGNLVPTYSIGELLGRVAEPVPEKQSSHKRQTLALLIGSPSAGAALLVDDRPVAIDLQGCVANDVDRQAMPALLQSVVTSQYCVDKRDWYLIDQRALFTRLASLGSGERSG